MGPARRTLSPREIAAQARIAAERLLEAEAALRAAEQALHVALDARTDLFDRGARSEPVLAQDTAAAERAVRDAEGVLALRREALDAAAAEYTHRNREWRHAARTTA